MEATSRENLFMPYANNKDADQPVHPRSPISFFVISSFYIQNFKPLASLCSWADWFESYLVKNPEDRFSRVVAHWILSGCAYKFEGSLTAQLRASSIYHNDLKCSDR